MRVRLEDIKPAAAPTAVLAKGTIVGATTLTYVTNAMEYKVNSNEYTAVTTGTIVEDIATLSNCNRCSA
jgi:hypothetical protein